MSAVLPLLISLRRRVWASGLIPELSRDGLEQWLWARATAAFRVDRLLLRLILATAGCTEG